MRLLVQPPCLDDINAELPPAYKPLLFLSRFLSTSPEYTLTTSPTSLSIRAKHRDLLFCDYLPSLRTQVAPSTASLDISENGNMLFARLPLKSHFSALVPRTFLIVIAGSLDRLFVFLSARSQVSFRASKKKRIKEKKKTRRETRRETRFMCIRATTCSFLLGNPVCVSWGPRHTTPCAMPQRAVQRTNERY